MPWRWNNVEWIAVFLTISSAISLSFGQLLTKGNIGNLDAMRQLEIQLNHTEGSTTENTNINVTSTPQPQSNYPSLAPTKTISYTPSFVPSSSPTLECHDLASYRSPINDLRCRDHRNTDCAKWKYLGLTDDQVLELLRSCPVSCGVDCGHSLYPSPSPTRISSHAPSQASILISFDIDMFLLNQSTPLLQDEVLEFEKATLVFLKNRINTEERTVISFKISSQTPFNNQRLLRGTSSTIDERILSLVATVTMMVTPDISEPANTAFLQNLVTSYIDSDDFRVFLKGNDILSDIDVTLVLSEIVVNPEVTKEPKIEDRPHSNGRPSAAAAIASSMVAIAAVVLVVFYLYRRDRFSGLHYFITRFKRGSADSDDINDRSSISRGEQSYCSDGAGQVDGVCVSRVLSQNSSDEKSFDLSVKAHQKNIRDDSDGEVTIKNRPTKRTDSSPSILNKTRNENSSLGYQKHIPTMIVIDNIDDDEIVSPNKTEENSNGLGGNPSQQVQSLYVKRIEATSDIVAALSGKKTTNPIQAYNLLNPFKYEENVRKIGEEISPHTVTSSRLSIGDTASLSTPCTTSNEADAVSNTTRNVQENRVFTFNSGQRDDFTILFERKMKQEEEKSAQKLTLRNLFKRKKRASIGEESVHSEASHYESDAEVSEVSEYLRERDRSEESNQQLNMEEMLMYKDDELGLNGDNDSADLDYDPNEMLGDLPTETSNHRHSKSASTTSFNFMHKRNMSEFSISDGYTYSFLAPTTGKLGIVIQSKGLMPPTIFQVKDYSPLFGQVEPGDKIISVDGQDTSKMNTTEITHLLAMKRSGNIDRTSRIKITVVSRYQKEGIQSTTDMDVPHHINVVDIHDEVRDDMEVPQSNEKKREDHSSTSEDEQSCHLLGTVNSDDWNESDDIECCSKRNYADQFL